MPPTQSAIAGTRRLAVRQRPIARGGIDSARIGLQSPSFQPAYKARHPMIAQHTEEPRQRSQVLSQREMHVQLGRAIVSGERTNTQGINAIKEFLPQ